MLIPRKDRIFFCVKGQLVTALLKVFLKKEAILSSSLFKYIDR